MVDFDPAQIEAWALAYLDDMKRPGIDGVLLGGSIARGQQWAHSDLETGILVEEKTASIPYFNVDSGRGVEIIQLVAPELRRQIAQVEAGDLAPLAEWPIQLYKSRVVSDPTGLLERFTAAFDRHLFDPPVRQARVQRHVAAGAAALRAAREEVEKGLPRAGLCDVRTAMNEAILALYWNLGELPRSQSRTESRLRDLTTRHRLPAFYHLYRDVFDLETTREAIGRHWPVARRKALAIAALWRASAFFEIAVDADFVWGEDEGILTVYRLYIPVIGRPDAGIFALLDDPDWAGDNADMLGFLGLVDTDPNAVGGFADRIDETLERLAAGAT